MSVFYAYFFFQAEDGIRDLTVTGVQTCALPILIEAAAEVLFGDTNGVVKIDCAEFQHSHEIAKLISSPPGYLPHRETSPLLTQANLDRTHTEDAKLTLLLFDAIEKASDSLWQLLLGILDKGTL